MAAKTLEEVVKLLEQQQKEIQRLKDIQEIQNRMSKYSYLHEVGEILDDFYAMKTPGASYEVAHAGCFTEESFRKNYSPGRIDEAARKEGGMFTHFLTTPVIEIAGDGKTAKGVWMSPGYETGVRDPETQKPTACFVYTKYGVDFVKEDGIWKQWHYHVYRVFMTPWNIPPTDEWEKNVMEKQFGGFGADLHPDLPTTVDNPYSVDTKRELEPRPPEPYETFDETFSYGP